MYSAKEIDAIEPHLWPQNRDADRPGLVDIRASADPARCCSGRALHSTASLPLFAHEQPSAHDATVMLSRGQGNAYNPSGVFLAWQRTRKLEPAVV